MSLFYLFVLFGFFFCLYLFSFFFVVLFRLSSSFSLFNFDVVVIAFDVSTNWFLSFFQFILLISFFLWIYIFYSLFLLFLLLDFALFILYCDLSLMRFYS